MKALVVDDDPVCRRLIESALCKWGAECRGAPDGPSALDLARRQRPDLIVADVVMPGMDGYDLCRRLKSEEGLGSVPVILLTALSDPRDVIRALQCGADAFLTKPYDRDHLIRTVERVVRRRDTPASLADGRIEVVYDGRAYAVDADVRRSIGLLLSTYENAVDKRAEAERANRALTAAERQLKELNTSLEATVAQRTAELEYSRQDIIWRLAKAAESRDEETGGHVTRVACYSQTLAEALGLPEDATQTLFLTSPLHDIGKIGVPDSILRKRGPLTPEERRMMETHCAIGAEILKQDPEGSGAYVLWRRLHSTAPRSVADNPILDMASRVALTHHERWDGSGYPAGTRGEETPIEGRIVALADTYDALSTPRPYKPAYPEEEVLHILREGAGTRFDPDVYAAFLEVIGKFRDICEAFSDRQAIAEFLEHNAP